MELQKALENQIEHIREEITLWQRAMEHVQKLLAMLPDGARALSIKQAWVIPDRYDLESGNTVDTVFLDCSRETVHRLAVDLNLGFRYYNYSINQDGEATWKYRVELDGFQLQVWTSPPTSCKIIPVGTKEVTVWEVKCHDDQH